MREGVSHSEQRFAATRRRFFSVHTLALFRGVVSAEEVNPSPLAASQTRTSTKSTGPRNLSESEHHRAETTPAVPR